MAPASGVHPGVRTQIPSVWRTAALLPTLAPARCASFVYTVYLPASWLGWGTGEILGMDPA